MKYLIKLLTDNKGFYLLIFFVAFLSLLPRLYYLDKPVWDWRDYQTLITTYWFTQDGIDLINYQTPLFGYPWQVPFEFPLYQAVGAWLSGFTLFTDVIFSSRIVSLIAFYLSAIALWLIVYEYTKDLLAVIIVSFVYLWHPYNIIYSTETLIDFSSVAFALFYIYIFIRWIKAPRKWYLAVVGVLLGVFGTLVKITTMGIVVIPISLKIFEYLKEHVALEQKNAAIFMEWVRRNLFLLICIGLILFIPILFGLVWVEHADTIKAANPLTVWLTSENLRFWTYGTLAQKTNPINWIQWLIFMNGTLLYNAVIAFPLIGGWCLRKNSKHLSELFVIAVLGIFFTLFTFFNLYHHEYYWIALSPYACILIGLGFYESVKFATRGKWWRSFLVSSVIILVIISSTMRVISYQKMYSRAVENVFFQFEDLAKTVRTLLPKEAHIIAVQTEWNPHFVYFTERKTMIVRDNGLTDFNCDLVKNDNYQAVVLVEEGVTGAQNKVLSCFKTIRTYSPQIYLVENPR